MMFSRQLHTLLRAGVPILRALAGLQDSAVNQRFKQMLANVRHSLESGIELSICFAQQGGVFDNFYVSMVRVGEMTGRLDDVFMRLFKHLEFEQFMRQQVKAALRYPAFVVLAMMVAVGVINTLVVPAFANVFKSFGAELPLATRILVASSNFTLNYGWLLAGGGVAGFVLLRRWIAQPSGRQTWDRLVLRLPLAGRIVQKATLSRFARSFSLALEKRRAHRAGAERGGADGGQRLDQPQGRRHARSGGAWRHHLACCRGQRRVHPGGAADDRRGRGDRRRR